ncbi:MAG TPA: hypothetical protein VFP65_06465 [Anaeromyxobacteraceae bacterium]|nr:hypothetical protein [Anaeromyxobacteraceae bacterium]
MKLVLELAVGVVLPGVLAMLLTAGGAHRGEDVRRAGAADAPDRDRTIASYPSRESQSNGDHSGSTQRASVANRGEMNGGMR